VQEEAKSNEEGEDALQLVACQKGMTGGKVSGKKSFRRGL